MTKRKERINTRYFPFAKGLPYKVKNGMYIVPELGSEQWNNVFENKKTVVVCHNGFIENLFATTILEAIRSVRPSQELEWIADSTFKDIWLLNGLGKECKNTISTETLRRYPVPLFYNADSTVVYINSCYNYRNIYTYYGQERYHDQKAMLKQIFRNTMLDWDRLYLPKMRQLRSDPLVKEAKSVKFSIDKPFVLLMPDVSDLSDHSIQCIDWKINEIRSFASMIKGSKYNLAILSPNVYAYNSVRAFIPSYTIHNILYMLSKASVVIAKDIDFIIGALVLGNAKTFSLKTKEEFKVDKNRKFLCVDNDVFMSKKLTPYDVFCEL